MKQITTAVRRQKNGKTSGIYNIPAEVLKSVWQITDRPCYVLSQNVFATLQMLACLDEVTET